MTPAKPLATLPAAKRLRAAARQAALSTAKRDVLLRMLRAQGYSLRELGALAGLSHTQVANLTRRN